ncbi:carboxypeptidase regulatory-like domain-containing protein [Agromyces sp. NPDC058110]|uniref:carboxypeptidase regulatory-like domain-containing protein n=1 Tax=Agromyces sp. NPDC058110 TaxID=3346345 RepID=UPI0036D777FF
MNSPELARPPRRTGRGLLGGLAALAMTVGLAAVGTPAANAAGAAADTGSITGVVTGEAGAPLQGVFVQLFHCDPEFDPTVQADCWTLLWGEGQSAKTGADGMFGIDGLVPGTYRASIAPQAETAQYVREYWDGVEALEAATDIEVVAGGAASIAPSLEVGATVSGTVVDDAGAPVAGGYVYAYLSNDLNSTRGGASVAADGTYSITGLPAGKYVLKAGPGWGAETDLVDEYWQDVYTSDAATRVDLASAAAFTADFVLNAGAAIEGTVTSDGAPVEGVEVSASSAGTSDRWVETVTATTAADGTYRLAGLEQADYVVSFSDFDGDLGQQYWQGVADRTSATALTVAPGDVVADIDAELTAGGSLSGVLTENPDGDAVPSASGYFDVLRENPAGEWERVTSARSDADGAYRVSGLAPGEYTVLTYGSSSAQWASTYFGGGYYPEDATAVAVTASTESGDVDVETRPGVSIRGTITDEHGGAAPDARLVILYERTPGNWVEPPAHGGAGDDISYAAGGMPPGNYVVRFEDRGVSTEQPYVTQYWQNAATQAEATVLEAPNGGTFEGVSAVMTRTSAEPEPEPAPVPTIAGVAQVDQALTADAGDWGADAALSYRWLADGEAVEGATAAEYTPADAESGAAISVEVTGIRPGEAALTATSEPTAALLPRFADVTGTGGHTANVRWAGAEGVIDGVRGDDGIVRFDAKTAATRATLAVALYRLAGSPEFALPAKPTFRDVPADHAAYAAIEWMKLEGITAATGTFGPNAALKRQEAAAFLYRAADAAFTAPAKATFTDVPKGSTYFTSIEWFAAERITGVTGSFRPTATVTREELATFLKRWDALAD